MDVTKACESRFSCRKYKADDVGNGLIEQCIECARIAPSALNKQPWKFYVTRGELKARIAKETQLFGANGFTDEAPVLVVVTVRPKIADKLADRGKGITRERDYTDVDGLITNEPGICLVTSFADCVPLYFVDPVKKAIGLSHSGWRGTVGKIGKRTVEMMGESFGSDPADILAAVGPSVCMDCYEVSGDVIEKFRQVFDEKLWPELFYEKENGKCQLDLWKANELIFLESGILPEHMAVTNLCTHCNSEILYSHRAAGDKRGNLCAFLALKEG